MPQEGAFMVTVYAPIMFPPAPLLLFAQDKHTSKGGSSNWVVRSCSKAVRQIKINQSGCKFLFNCAILIIIIIVIIETRIYIAPFP